MKIVAGIIVALIAGIVAKMVFDVQKVKQRRNETN